MNGHAHDYGFGQKNNWRRWAWNRLAERIDVPARDAIVLYLAGAEDRDRRIALERGFRPDNLIAIESHASTLREIRRKRTLCIHGDFWATVYSWPRHIPIHGIIGDFCCGLDHNTGSKIMGLIAFKPTLSVAAAFNFLRGRDPSSSEVRAAAQQLITAMSVFDVDSPKHRGAQIASLMTGFAMGEVWKPLVDRYRNMNLSPSQQERSERLLLHDGGRHFAALIAKNVYRCAFNSYRSTSGQVFDSLVFKHKDSGIPESDMVLAEATAELRDTIGDQRQARRISAVLAHRTMRMMA